MKELYVKIKHIIVFFALLCLAAGIFIFNDDVKEAFISDLTQCIRNILPPLFPMLIVSTYLSETGLPPFICKLLIKPLQIFPGIPSDLLPNLLFGAIGGYPVGVKTLSQSVTENPQWLNEARLLALCNINPGPAFAILVVGKSVFGSKNIGLSLYFSVTAANFFLYYLLRKIKKPHTKERPVSLRLTNSPSDALINAVRNATQNVCSVTAWIIFFGAVFAMAGHIRSSFLLFTAKLIGEITRAVNLCSQIHALPLCAFALSFAGICIFCQLLPDLKILKIKPTAYFLCRFICGGLSAISEAIIIRLFPSIMAVNAAAQTAALTFEADLKQTMLLMIVSVMFMISINENNLHFILKKRRNVII